MAKYDWNTFRNYVAFLAGTVAPGTRHPHHDSELISCYHDAFRTWGHCHNNIVLFYHDSPITRSHFMDPTDRAIKGFYCICTCIFYHFSTWCRYLESFSMKAKTCLLCIIRTMAADVLELQRARTFDIHGIDVTRFAQNILASTPEGSNWMQKLPMTFFLIYVFCFYGKMDEFCVSHWISFHFLCGPIMKSD